MLVKFSDMAPVDVSDDRINELRPFSDALCSQVFAGSRGTFSDAGEAGSFLISQLAHVEQTIYSVQRIPMQYAELVPVTSEIGAAANSHVYQITDWVGQFKRVSPNARDLPKVEVGYAQVTLNVANGGGSYGYNVQEMRESAFLRRPLNAERARVADEAWQRHLNDVAIVGEVGYGLYGLINMNTIPTGNAPVGAWGGGTTTEVQCMSDLRKGILTVLQNSAYNDYVTTILVAPSVMDYLSGAFVGTNPQVSLFKFLKENNIAFEQKKIVLEFQMVPQLETAGAGGTRRTIFYKKDPSRLKFHNAKDLTFLAPQFEGLTIVMNGDYRYAGMQWTYPKSGYFMDAC